MEQQVIGLGVPIIRGFVSSLERRGRPLLASYASGVIETQRVVLATGIMDKQTRLAEWVDAVRRGELRYCSICDAFEAIGRKIAVVGPFGHAIGKALFMRVYSAEVILVPADDVRDEAGVQQLADAAVQVAPCLVALQRKEGGIEAVLADGTRERFDIVYPAMGADVRSELAVQFGVSHTSDGFLKVDDKQRSNVDHLYGIGDVVTDLHQISVAFGHAAVAACHAHHSLPMRYA